jgi:methionine sulfoxide reductase heme-binding subunit
MTPTQRIERIYKPAVLVVSLLPFAALVWRAFTGGGASLGANPVEAIQDTLGQWALRFLLITLAVTPLRAVLHVPSLLRFRRMFGLTAFFYVLMHFMTWLGLDQRFNFAGFAADVARRPFITIGFAALVMLMPLAVTSTDRMMRRLGRRWTRLHRLVYPIAICGIWHYYWQVKADVREPLIYAAVLTVLLAWRVRTAWVRRTRRVRAGDGVRGEPA